MGKKVIVIVGPTCSGKTKLGLILAEKLKSEIISADSRQVYKYLTIGTAKPSLDELSRIKHHFIDELEPDQEFNADIFSKRAKEIISRLIDKDTIPIVVGGSGLYIKALVYGITQTLVSDKSLRNELLELRKKYGNDYIYEELKKIDPTSAEKMLPQNWKRVIRAIEVFRLTGKPIWQHHIENPVQHDFEFFRYGLRWERNKLYQNIECRVEEMIKNGFVEEVKLILEKGYSKEINSLNTLGYKEIIDLLNNKFTFDETVNRIKINTRRFAKRQLTWFNADKSIKWFDIDSYEKLNNIAENILKDFYERKN